MQKSTLQPEMMRGTAGGKKTARTTRMTGERKSAGAGQLSGVNRTTHGTRRRRCPAVQDLRDCRALCRSEVVGGGGCLGAAVVRSTSNVMGRAGCGSEFDCAGSSSASNTKRDQFIMIKS